MFLNSKYQGKYRMISEEILWLKKLEKYICYTIATMKTYSNYLLIFFDWLYQVYQDSCSKHIKNGTSNIRSD